MYVCGRLVPVSAQSIDDLFSLPTPAHDGYAAILANPTDQIFQQILHTIVVEGTSWTYSRTQRLQSCKRQDLRHEAKLWFYLIRHSIMPTGHVSNINQERLLLISTIMDGTPLNLGCTIESQMWLCATRMVGELFFPSLTTRLCR